MRAQLARSLSGLLLCLVVLNGCFNGEIPVEPGPNQSNFATNPASPKPSSTLSSVTTAFSTIQAGSTTMIMLTAKDDSGFPIITGGASVWFTTSGGSSGTFSATTDNGNGIYTANFTGTTAGAATTITAYINGYAVAQTTTVTVNPGSSSASQSQVSVSSASVAAGSTATFTLRTRDAYGNQLTTGGLAVAFSVSGGTSSGGMSVVTDNLDGTYTATFTGSTAGSASSVGATIMGSVVTSSLPTITVIPGSFSLSQSAVSVSPASIAVGNTSTLKVTAKDAYGNPLTSGGLTVAFSVSGGTSAGTIGAVTDGSNGTYTATFTGTAAGTPLTIGASINAGAITSTLPTLTVTPPLFNLEVPIEMVDNGLASNSSQFWFNRTYTALDPADYDGAVTYYFEVVAQNTDTAARNVYLTTASPATIASITIPAATGSPQRFRAAWTPSAGNTIYQVSLDGTPALGNLKVLAARIIVSQVGASMTRLFIPLVGADEANTSSLVYGIGSEVDGTLNTVWVQQNTSHYSLWVKNSANYMNLAPASPWSFEAVLGTAAGANAYATLYNYDASTQVAASQLVVPGAGNVSYAEVPFADNAANFTNGSRFAVQIKTDNAANQANLYRAGIRVKLSSIARADIHYRLSRFFSASANTDNLDQRILMDTTRFTNPSVYLEAVGLAGGGIGAAGNFWPLTCGPSDTVTACTQLPVGNNLYFNNTLITVQRSPALTLTSGDRFGIRLAPSLYTIYNNMSFFIVGIQ